MKYQIHVIVKNTEIFQSGPKWLTDQQMSSLAKIFDMHTVVYVLYHQITELQSKKWVLLRDEMQIYIIWWEFGFQLRLAKSHRFTATVMPEREIEGREGRVRKIKIWSEQRRLTHASQCTCQNTVQRDPIHFVGRGKGTVVRMCTMPGHSSSAQSLSLLETSNPKPLLIHLTVSDDDCSLLT